MAQDKYIGLLLLLWWLFVIVVTYPEEYTFVNDISKEKKIGIHMSPLQFHVSQAHCITSFHTQSEDEIFRLYCGDSSFASKLNSSVTEVKWSLTLPVNDENIMLLLLKKGILCKAVTSTHIFPFLIYSKDILPNIKPVIFEHNGRAILHTEHHFWLQVATTGFLFVSIVIVFIVIYCCSHKFKGN